MLREARGIVKRHVSLREGDNGVGVTEPTEQKEPCWRPDAKYQQTSDEQRIEAAASDRQPAAYRRYQQQDADGDGEARGQTRPVDRRTGRRLTAKRLGHRERRTLGDMRARECAK